MALLRSDLVALARKYRTLAELRRAEEQLLDLDPRALLRALATEFPGALRELDSLSLAEIDRRLEAVEAAARRGAAEPWMEWMLGFHQRMRVALSIKRRLHGQRQVRAREAARIADAVSHEEGCVCETRFVEAVAHPPRGRISVLVLEQLEVDFRARPGSMSAVLFPALRGR